MVTFREDYERRLRAVAESRLGPLPEAATVRADMGESVADTDGHGFRIVEIEVRVPDAGTRSVEFGSLPEFIDALDQADSREYDATVEDSAGG